MTSTCAPGDMSIGDAWQYVQTTSLSVWGKTTRRMRITGAIVLVFVFSILLFGSPSIPDASSLSNLPKVSLSYHDTPSSPYNASKVALLVENRSNPILAPLLLHFMSVVPPDWRFRFMGSLESVAFVNQSMAIRQQVEMGKLDLTYIPANMSTSGQEMISRFFTNLWLYETVLAPAEWLLIFQTDSMLCANSRQTLNNWLEYDWVGAPWSPSARFGGNGGLSLRRVSAIVQVLRNQERPANGDAEDVWLSDRLGHRPGAKMANGTASITFSGENFAGDGEKLSPPKDASSKTDPGKFGEVAGNLVKGLDEWREGFYEPMGYHTGSSGRDLHGPIWGTQAMRKHIYDYCPEVKMTIDMDVAQYVPGTCNAEWKRWDQGEQGGDEMMADTEIIDGVEYPMVPAGLLVPW